MFIFKDTKQRANIYAPYTDPQGIKYATVPLELVEDIVEPAAPEDYSEEFYYKTELDVFPYVVYTKKSEEQIKEIRRNRILSEIAGIESGQARAVREAALGDTAYLKQIDDRIKELRAQL